MVKGRVLAVDEDQSVLESIVCILESQGYRVDPAESGKEGIQRAGAGEYDIAVIDPVAGDDGGLRLLGALKRVRPALPVVLLCSGLSVAQAVLAMKRGACDVIEKPFTAERLVAAVDEGIATALHAVSETAAVVNHDELCAVLARAAADEEFSANILYHGGDALESYTLTADEKLALLTGDAAWIEEHVGPLPSEQRRWLDGRSGAEIW
jgi:DNA-binding NtrC family response regulator